MFIITGIVLVLLFAGVLYTLLNRSFRKYYVPAKMLNSAYFVFLCIFFGLHFDAQDRMFSLLLPFLLCFAGDFFLGLHNRTRKKRFMLIGTGFFLFAHIFFLIPIFFTYPLKMIDLAFPIVSVFVVAFIGKKDTFTLKNFMLPAFVYALFVSELFWKGLLVAFYNPTTANLCFALGGFFFIISDSLIILLYFKVKRGYTVHGFNLATYYLATYFLALSLCF